MSLWLSATALFALVAVSPEAYAQAPSISVLINGGAAATNSTSVTLSISVISGTPTEMYITNTSGCGSGGTWQPYNANPSWTTTTGAGTKRVYVRVRNAALQNSTCVNDAITLDTTAPVASSIGISGGATTVNNTSVTLAHSGTGTPTEMYRTQTAGCGSGGSWIAYATTSAWTLANANAANTLYYRVRDAAGNQSTCINSAVITHDNVAPTFSTFTINGGALYTNTRPVTLNFSASGTPNQYYVTTTAGCTAGGTWTAYAANPAYTLSTGAGLKTLYAKVRDAALNESACLTTSITYDATAPTLTSISLNAGAAQTNSTSATVDFVASGTPTEAYITSTSGCASGGSWVAYSASLPRTLTTLNGTNTVYAKVRDAALNESTCRNDAIVHDNVAPTTPTISINAAAALTNSTNVTLTLSAAGTPSQMYITNTAGCGSGGTWATYATSSAWTLGQTNGTATVYVKYRDAALNESTCVNDTITHDNAPPVISATAPLNGSYVTTANMAALPVTGTCSENGRAVNITGSGGLVSPTCTAGAYSTTRNFTSAANGPLTVIINHSDAAGNNATQITLNLTKDTVAPASPTISINSGAASTNSLSVTLTLSATGTPAQMYVTQTAGCGSGGSWAAYATSSPWTLTTANATNTVYVKYRDAAGNESTCVNDSIVQDSLVPTLAVSVPVNGSYITTANMAAFTVSGACSENGRAVVITGTASASPTCTAGAFSTNFNLSATPQGAVNFAVNHSDASGNAATTVNLALTKDTAGPGSPTISINAGASHTNSLNATLTLSAAGTPAEQYVTSTAGCGSGGTWATFAASTPRVLSTANATNTVYVKYRDAALNESTCVNDTIIHDNVVPTLSLSAPAEASYVSSANVTSITFNGNCSENGRAVNLTGDVTASPTCTAGAWSTNQNLTSAPQGTLNIAVNHSDVATNAATTVNLTLNKDTVAPTSPVLTINGGAAYTNDVNVTLAPSAGGASEMYITQTAGCSAGGSWEAYATSSPLTLNDDNASNTIYIKYRDAALNESACVNATIIHDDVDPTLAVDSPDDGSIINTAAAPALLITGTCSENGRSVFVTGSASGSGTCTAGAWSATVNVAAVADGALTFAVNHSDAATNAATTVNLNLTKNTTAPASPAISINAGAAYTNDVNVNLILSASGATEMYVTQTAGCSAGGSWEVYDTAGEATLGNANASNTVYVKFRNIYLNESACVNDTIVHDNVVPTLTVDTPAFASTISSVNAAAVNFSGTCSEDGRQVVITGDASDTVSCVSGAWSAILNLSALPDGNLTVVANHDDAAGNEANAVNHDLVKDTSGPSAPSIAINSGATFTNSTSVTLNLSAAGAADMYITQTAACAAGGTWEAFAASAPWTLADTQATNTVYAKFRDGLGNESSCVSAVIDHDAAPAVAILSPIVGTYINQANYNNLVVSGSCSPNGANVVLSGDLSSSALCSGGAWSATFDTTFLLNGPVTFLADISNSNSQSATQASLVLTKDTAPPGAGPYNSVTLSGTRGADGVWYTNSLSVTVVINATEATEMYITPTAGCASEGSWEPYASSKAWNLQLPNDTNWVYGKFRDVAGNVTDCAVGKVLHDDTPAVFTIAEPADGSFINLANRATYTLSGTCSDNGKKVFVTGGLTTNATCTGGLWSRTLNLTSKPDGVYNLTFNYTDDHGHPATPVNLSVTKDTAAPVMTIVTPANASYVNEANRANVGISGTCNKEGQPINISGAVTASTNCVAGEWATTVDLTSVPDGEVTITGVHSDAAGNSSPNTNRKFKLDTGIPTVAITSPASGTLINTLNQGYTVVSGTCSEASRAVVISGATSGSVNCSSGTWMLALDFTAAAQGAISITATHADVGGNVAQDTLNFNRDSEAPSSNSIVINGGAAATTDTEVALTLASSGATDMYVTHTTNCIGYGTWEPYAASKPWTLTSANRSIAVAVKFRDNNNNESACITASIIHDNKVPVWTDGPVHAALNSSMTASPLVTYAETATDGQSGLNKYQYAIGTGLTGGTATNVKGWTDVSGGSFTATGLSLSAGTRYFVHMKAVDNVGYEVVRSSTGWLADVVAPNLTVTSHAQNAVVSQVDQRIAGQCEGTNDVTISYSAGVTGPSTAACSGNQYHFFVEFSGTSGARTISLAQQDATLNNASVDRDLFYSNKVEIKGQVNVIAQAPDGSRFYGGNISSYTSGKANGLVRVNASTGAKDSLDVKSGFNGNVFAMVELADGGMVFGGDFTEYRGRVANRLAKLDANGELDLTFNPQSGSNGTNGIVYALAANGNTVYAGGAFTFVKGQQANRIAKFDAQANVDATFNPAAGNNGAGGTVRALALNGTNLYIGGDFTTYHGVSVSRVAKLDAITGVRDAGFSASGPEKTVHALLYSGGAVYLGGTFTLHGANAANFIAKVDATSGTLDTGFNPAAGGNGFTAGSIVYALADFGGDVVAAGAFTTYRGAVANNIAKISPSGVLDTTFNPATGGNGFDNQLLSAYVTGGNLFVGGAFTSYRGALVRHIAKLNSNGVLDTGFSPATGVDSAGIDGAVTAITSTASGIYLAGSFTTYRNSHVVHGLLKTNSAGAIDLTFNLQSGADGFNGEVRSIKVGTGTIYVGGAFTTYRGQPANGIAKLDFDGNLDTTFNPGSGNNGASGTVAAIDLSGNDLYIGGSFTKYRGANANRVAKLDATTGALDTTFSPSSGANGANNWVYALKVDGSTLWIGGAFSAYRTQVANRIAKLDAATGALDTVFNPASGPNGAASTVFSIVISGSDMYLAGSFTAYRGTTVNRVAKISPSTGDLDAGFSAAGGANAGISSMILAGGSLYITGDFFTYRGATANRVAKIDATTGALDTTFSPASGENGLTGQHIANPKATPEGTALMHDGTNLTIGGVFSLYRGQTHNFSVVVDSTGAIVP